MSIEEEFNRLATTIHPRRSVRDTSYGLVVSTVTILPTSLRRSEPDEDMTPEDVKPPTPRKKCCFYPWPKDAPSDGSSGPVSPLTSSNVPTYISVTVIYSGGSQTIPCNLSSGPGGAIGYGGNGTRVMNNDGTVAWDGGVSLSVSGHEVNGVFQYGWYIYLGPNFGFFTPEDDPSDSPYVRECLFGPYPNRSPSSTGLMGQSCVVSDQFNSEYEVNGGDDFITRATTLGDLPSCVWTGPKTGGGMWKLDYGQTTPYKWHLTSSNPSPTDDDKDTAQGDPIGSYGTNTLN